MPDNSVTLVGNVTREPELRYTAAGQAMAKFGLAVNRRWQNRQTNAWEESTSFFDVVAWREFERGGHFAAWERPHDHLWGVRTALEVRRR